MSRLAVRAAKLVRALLWRRRRPDQVRRILVAHQLLLGDTILLAPLLKALALRYPKAERVVLVRPPYAALFADRPYGVVPLPFERRDARSQWQVLASGPYDLAFVPDDNRYAWLARAARSGWIVGFAKDRPAWKNWMIDEAIDYPATPTAWADMAAALTHLPAIPQFRKGEWPAPPAPHFEPPKPPYAVLHVGASTPLKFWRAERWRALADTLGRRGFVIVWSGGAGETELLKAIGVEEGEIDCIGSLDLAALWKLLAGSRLLVCPDTGIAHLARLVGVPTVALFGPGSAVVHGPGEFWKDALFWTVTDPAYPCRDQHVLFRREVPWVLRCGRSFGTGAGQCPRAGCMDVLAFDPILDAVDIALSA